MMADVANPPHSFHQARGDMGDSTFSVAPSPPQSPVSSIQPTVSRRVSIEHVHTNNVGRDRARSSQESTDSAMSLRFQRPRTDHSKTSSRSSFALSRMSSNVTSLRESFFGVIGRPPIVNDPLELSPTQEFELDVIDESGGIHETIGQILKPQVDFKHWSNEGYVVLGLGSTLLVLLLILTETVTSLNGYTIDPGLVFGSLLTLLLCACVFVTYHGVQSFQRHPNPLIYYKCIVDTFLALRFLLDPLLLEFGVYKANDERSCAYLSGVTQFLFLSSDCWYFAQIVDLYWSLTNPFMSVKANRRRFKILVYLMGALTGLLAASAPSIHGFADGNYCWTKRTATVDRNFYRFNKGSWLLFYMWMILFYLSGIAVLAFGIKRLRSGLRDTLQSRKDMLRNGVLFITSYTIYWTIVFIWYALSFQRRSRYDRNGQFAPSHVFRTFTFTLTGRGAVDYFVWFMVNKPSLIRANWLQFTSDSADKQFSAQLNTTLQEELIYFTIEGMTRAIQIAEDELLRSQEQSLSTQKVESDASGTELEQKCAPHEHVRDTDPKNSRNLLHSAQKIRMLNTIQEVITAGLRRNTSSIDAEVATSKQKNSKEQDFSFEIPAEQRPPHQYSNSEEHPSNHSTATSTESRSASLPMSNTKTASIRFTPYKPQAFAELRQAYEIKAVDLLHSFQTSTKPNISEGASGAFMFFSGDKKYIVKSMAEEEARFLCAMADEYVQYLILNPASLITKFYGCFKITMYDKRFYFIVMENLFDVMEEGVQIHHRFDIKGSWINRSYKRPRRGAKVKCRHCSMLFKYGAKKQLLQCPNVVGLHEPNVVLKDNDLRTRMRIGTTEGVALYDQLRDDSLFLCHLGIMDYSLLLGVMDIEFVVEQPSRHLQPSSIQTGTNVSSTGLTNDSAISSDWSSIESASSGSNNPMASPQTESKASSSLLSMPNKSVTPSIHSLFQQSRGNLDQSRCPATGGEPRPKRSMRKSQRVFGPGYYYVGIIDILQTWTLQKKMERFWKVQIRRKDGDGLSAIDPVQYQRRFEAKLREIIAIPKDYCPQERRKDGPLLQSMRRLSPVFQAAAAFENAAAAQKARRLAHSSDMILSNSSATDESDLEQAGRNPQPILLPFNQRLITSNSIRSQLSLGDFAV